MTTTFLLIRHARHELGHEIIAGRTPGVHLSDAGRTQADGLCGRLADVTLDAIYSSPMERTVETAQPLASLRGLTVEHCPELVEVDFGDWTGRGLELRGCPGWAQWNSFRSGHAAPNGESMVSVQERFVSHMRTLSARHDGQCVALFSHGDVIKAAVAYFLGAPLDLFQRIEISPAAITVIDLADEGPYVRCVNNSGALSAI